MSDNKNIPAVRSMLKTLFPGEPRGHLASRLNNLTAMVSGIVGSRSTNLSAIAGKVPGGPRSHKTKPESRVKRFERWLRNNSTTLRSK